MRRYIIYLSLLSSLSPIYERTFFFIPLSQFLIYGNHTSICSGVVLFTHTCTQSPRSTSARSIKTPAASHLTHWHTQVKVCTRVDAKRTVKQGLCAIGVLYMCACALRIYINVSYYKTSCVDFQLETNWWMDVFVRFSFVQPFAALMKDWSSNEKIITKKQRKELYLWVWETDKCFTCSMLYWHCHSLKNYITVTSANAIATIHLCSEV